MSNIHITVIYNVCTYIHSSMYYLMHGYYVCIYLSTLTAVFSIEGGFLKFVSQLCLEIDLMY